MSVQETELIELAKLGIEAEAFLSSPLGRFLMKKADDEEAAATVELIETPPTDIEKNREIRNQIHVARMFKVWINESVQCGRAAHAQLQQLEDMARHGA